jgi:hypothetical protein
MNASEIKPIEFTKDAQLQEYYAGGLVEVKFKMPIWVAILKHLDVRPGAIEAQTICKELFPALPLFVCRNMIDELRRKGYIKEYHDITNNTICQLTESAQEAIRTGYTWESLPEDKVLKFYAGTCNDFNNEITYMDGDEAYIEDKAAQWNDSKSDDIELPNMPISARERSKQYQVDIAHAEIRTKSEQRKSKSSDIPKKLALQITETTTKLYLNNAKISDIDLPINRTQLIQRQFPAYDPASNSIGLEYDHTCLYNGKQVSDHQLDKNCFRELQVKGWTLTPQQIAVQPADETSAQWAYIAELIPTLANMPQLVNIAAHFDTAAQSLAAGLSEKWNFNIEPVALDEMVQLLEQNFPQPLLRQTDSVNSLAWRARLLGKSPIDLDTEHEPNKIDSQNMKNSRLSPGQLIASAKQAIFITLPQWPEDKWLQEEITAAAHRGVRTYVVLPNTAFEKLSEKQREFLRLHTLTRVISNQLPYFSLVMANPHLETGKGLINTGQTVACHPILANQPATSMHTEVETSQMLHTLHQWFVQTLLSANEQLDTTGTLSKIKTDCQAPQSILIHPNGQREPLWEALIGYIEKATDCAIELSVGQVDTQFPIFEKLKQTVIERSCQVKIILPQADTQLRTQFKEANIALDIQSNQPNCLHISGNWNGRIQFTPNWTNEAYQSPYALGLIGYVSEA